MSKNRTASKEVKEMSPQEALNELQRLASARKKAIMKQLADGKGKLPVMIMLILALSLVLLNKVTIGASTAFLYLFGFNGKVSGRTGGNVYMRNGRGRGFTVPALVRNSYTMTARGIFAVLSASYRGLTTSEIEQWMNFSYDRSDRFGQSQVVRGKEAYIGLNTDLINVGYGPITAPPVLVAVPAINTASMTAVAATGVITLTFTASPTAATVDHLVFATQPLSHGITRPSTSAFRLVQVIPGGTSSTFNISVAYAAKFGVITTAAGNKIFVQLYGVENTTGQKVPSVGMSAVIS